MATLPGKYWSNDSYRPRLSYTITASETSRNSTSVTHKITVRLALESSGSYGFEIRIHGQIGNTAIDQLLKTTTGSLSSSVTFSITTTGVSASGGTIFAKLYSFSPNDSTHWQNSFNTGDKNLDVSKWNTKPSLSGKPTIRCNNSSGDIIVNASGNVMSGGIYPENVSNLYISWPAGSDAEQSSGLKYGVNQIVNGGAATTIVYPTTATNFTAAIGSGNQGQKLQYYVNARDNYNELSNSIYSYTITKNTFTGDTLSSSSSLGYSTSSLSFSYTGAKNTNGNISFTRSLSCDGLTVYNPSLGASPATITVYRSGPVPSTCYVKFDDIKAKFASSSYRGTLNFTLSTTNAYGTKKTSSKSISVDLQVAPNASGAPVVSTDANSTSYVTSVGSTKYYIPANGRKTRVNWTAGSGKLGEAVSYDVYYAYNSGAWQLIGNTTNTYIDHTFSDAVSAKQSVKYLVRTKVSYGLYADATQATAVDYHYWNPPSIVVNTPMRAATTATTTIALKLNTSIPSGVSPSGTWQSFVSGSATVHQSGTLTSSTANQNISMSGLAENSGYTLKITYKDNTAFSANIVQEVSIPANQPVFFVNQYGVGVGGAKATDEKSLIVDGNASITGDISDVQKIVVKELSAENQNVSGDLAVQGNQVLTHQSANGYPGMLANHSNNTWIRTTQLGLIPYQSGGHGSLGTSSWPFDGVHANNIYQGGSLVVERGGNGNGEYTKFADGTLICVKVLNVTTTITSTWGNIYTSGLPINMGPPAHSFVAADYKMSITMGSYNSGGEQYTAGILVSKGNGYRPPGTSDFGQAIELFRGTSMPSKNYNIQIIAIGRWK